MTSRFFALLSPGRIGGLDVRNRMAVTAMGVNLAEADGTCGERLLAYHEAQARGGVGLVIEGVTSVAWPVGANTDFQVALSEDRFIPGLAATAKAVQRHGARYAVQLHHGGLVGMQDMIAGRPVWGPSIPDPPPGDFTDTFLLEELQAAPFARIRSVEVKVMTPADIALVVEQFAAAAVRARDAGVDGVEIHGGHGYLLSSFVSPKSNTRTDAYGGPLENRARFLLEVVRAVREAVGRDFPVWSKLDSREVGVQGGITLDDAVRTAAMVEAAGADAITVTTYHATDRPELHSESHTPHIPAFNLESAARIRASLNIPVIASGRLEPEVADAAIGAGRIDFVAMGRKLLADPELPAKLLQGRAKDVRPCIYCYTCISRIYVGDHVRCAVDPATGFETTSAPLPAAATVRTFAVVGGGPAGMAAAAELAEAGHRVILLEREARLGGTLRVASIAYEANEPLLDWLERRVKAAGAEIRLGVETDVAAVRALDPDVVVVATGAVRELPDIPGVERASVFSGDDLRALLGGEDTPALRRKLGGVARLAAGLGARGGLTGTPGAVRAASKVWMPLGRRIAIVGGELVGLELAEFLAVRGRSVSVIDTAPRLGGGLQIVRRMRLLAELRDHGVELKRGVADLRIEADGVAYLEADGRHGFARADQVIVAKGARGELSLAEALRDAGLRVVTAGDCQGVGYLEGAIRGAHDAVRALSDTSPTPAREASMTVG